MTEKDREVISEAFKIFIYTNDLLCNPSAYDVRLMERNYNSVIATYGFCNLFLSEYLSNIENVVFMLNNEACKTKYANTKKSHSIHINWSQGNITSEVIIVNIAEFIEENKNKIIVAPVVIYYPNNAAHQTALIIDPSRKTVDFFDPLWDADNSRVAIDMYKEINNHLLEKVGPIFSSGWTWYSMEDFNNYKGWQTMSEPFRQIDPTLKQNYVVGYCVSWCILYAILKSIVSYAPVNNTGLLIVELFPIVATTLATNLGQVTPYGTDIAGTEATIGLTLHVIIRNFALELILSLFEKDQNRNLLGLQDSETPRAEPKEDSCGIDRITHATQEIIKQLRKENARDKRSVADATRSKTVFPPTPYLPSNIVSDPNLYTITNSPGFDFGTPNNVDTGFGFRFK